MDSKPRKTARKSAAAAQLTDDLVVEILSRLPAKSWCRFKCVSKSWLAFSSHPYYRNKLPQPIAGLFFHPTTPGSPGSHHLCTTDFTPLSPAAAASGGIGTTLSFLPRYHYFEMMHSCNGLLVCRFQHCSPPAPDIFHYLVCNPTTKKWTVLPDPVSEPDGCCYDFALGYDPAVSAGFHVFCFQRMESMDTELLSEMEMTAVADLWIFSSETGEWAESQIIWQEEVVIGCPPYVFLNGMLHVLAANRLILAVDTEGRSGRILQLPKETDDFDGCLGQTSGCLKYMLPEQAGQVVSVWSLQDYEQWVLEGSFSMKDVYGTDDFVYRFVEGEVWCRYTITGFDLARDIIFLTDNEEDKFLSYSTTTGELNEIGRGSLNYIVYVPCYLDAF